MNVAFVVTNSDFSGAPRNVIDAAESLEGNYNLYLFAGGRGDVFADRIGLFRKSHFDPYLRSDFSLIGSIKSMRCLFRFVTDNRIDVIWCHSFKAALISRIVGAMLRKRIIYTVHGWPWRGFSGVKRLLIVIIERAATLLSVPTLVFLSDTECRNSPKFFRRFRHYIVPNTTSLVVHARVPSPNLGRVLMIARIDRSKNHRFLFEVCGSCASIGALELVGAGTEQFDGMILKNGCRVSAWGEVKNVLAHIQRSDVVVLFSKFEALPISLLEALSQGRPMVASNVGSIPEVVIDGVNGFVVGGDVGVAAGKLDVILSDSEVARAFGAASAAHFERNFSRVGFDEKVRRMIAQESLSR